MFVVVVHLARPPSSARGANWLSDCGPNDRGGEDHAGGVHVGLEPLLAYASPETASKRYDSLYTAKPGKKTPTELVSESSC